MPEGQVLAQAEGEGPGLAHPSQAQGILAQPQRTWTGKVSGKAGAHSTKRCEKYMESVPQAENCSESIDLSQSMLPLQLQSSQSTAAVNVEIGSPRLKLQ